MVIKTTSVPDLLVNYEKGEFIYLNYFIRSYKRILSNSKQILSPEKLIFTGIKLRPKLTTGIGRFFFGNPSNKKLIGYDLTGTIFSY